MTGFDQSTTSDGFIEKLVAVRRTTKVVEGGANFSFSVFVVVGDGHSRVGYGFGKAKEVPVAVQKAMEAARKNMVQVDLNGKTLHYEIRGRHGASNVLMLPAPKGTGIIAGGAMRAVFEVLGVEDVVTKCYGSTNPINVVRATVDSLVKAMTPEEIARKRGKRLKEIVEGGEAA